MNILLAAATPAELAPFLDHIHPYRVPEKGNSYSAGGCQIQVCITGIGILATAYALTKAYCSSEFDLAVQAGIAGSFTDQAPIGSVWKIRHEILADLGAEEKDGSFMDLFDMGLLDEDEFPFKERKLTAPPLPFPLLTHLEETDAITVHTVSGTASTRDSRLHAFHPRLESMEGAAFHYVSLKEKVPFLQVRSVSNRVTERDKSQWNIPLAIANLNRTLVQLLDELTSRNEG